MKDSDAISAESRGGARTVAAHSSPQARRFKLSQRSSPPDPALNAYRDDLADVALAGRVIASHYAEPVIRSCVSPTSITSDATATLEIGVLDLDDRFALLDCSRGRAWGYVVATHRVGYVDEDALA